MPTLILDAAGYRVLTATTGPLGVALLQTGERIDLLITDVGLPGELNGRGWRTLAGHFAPNSRCCSSPATPPTQPSAGPLDKGLAVPIEPFNIIELERRIGDRLAERPRRPLARCE